jgi:hypothetical protein
LLVLGQGCDGCLAVGASRAESPGPHLRVRGRCGPGPLIGATTALVSVAAGPLTPVAILPASAIAGATGAISPIGAIAGATGAVSPIGAIAGATGAISPTIATRATVTVAPLAAAAIASAVPAILAATPATPSSKLGGHQWVVAA